MNVRAALAVAALLAVAACGSSEPTSTKPTFGGGSAPAVPADELAAAKQSAGIQDCPPPGAKAATDLPDLTLSCLGGGRDVDLARLTGTPTVINVWASWCAPCRAELPLLARADQAYGVRVRVLGIDFDDSAPDHAIDLARTSGVTYPLLVDRAGETRKPFGVVGLPQTVFVDAQGRMVATERVAFRSYVDLTAAISKHLGVAR
jgi:thiol-disulfide isomerase/thioredoxin